MAWRTGRPRCTHGRSSLTPAHRSTLTPNKALTKELDFFSLYLAHMLAFSGSFLSLPSQKTDPFRLMVYVTRLRRAGAVEAETGRRPAAMWKARPLAASGGKPAATLSLCHSHLWGTIPLVPKDHGSWRDTTRGPSECESWRGAGDSAASLGQGCGRKGAQEDGHPEGM